MESKVHKCYYKFCSCLCLLDWTVGWSCRTLRKPTLTNSTQEFEKTNFILDMKTHWDDDDISAILSNTEFSTREPRDMACKLKKNIWTHISSRSPSVDIINSRQMRLEKTAVNTKSLTLPMLRSWSLLFFCQPGTYNRNNFHRQRNKSNIYVRNIPVDLEEHKHTQSSW